MADGKVRGMGKVRIVEYGAWGIGYSKINNLAKAQLLYQTSSPLLTNRFPTKRMEAL